MKPLEPSSLTRCAGEAASSQPEAAQTSHRKPSMKSQTRKRALEKAGAESTAPAQGGAESTVPAQAAARIPSLALTKPAHVREAAAGLFNRAYKRWGSSGTAAEMRAIGYFLNLARTSIADIEIEERLTAIEEVLESRATQARSAKLPAD